MIKPLVVGRDIRKWAVDYKNKWLIYMHHGIDADRLPAVLAHLRHFKEQLESRATNQRWYELQQPQRRYVPAFEQPKIVFPDIAKQSRFAFDTTGAYLGNTAYIIPKNDPFLLGVLNSRAVEALYIVISAQVRGGYLRFIRQYAERIPVPNAPGPDRTAIAELAERCVAARGQGPEVAAWEAEIDARVARLYGLVVE